MRTMTDFENRVREALEHSAGGAPGAVGLAEGARSRLRRRRRTVAGVAATAVVFVAVPVGVAVLDRDEARDPRRDSTDVVASDLPAIPDGWRWESWRDVQIAVPGDWTTGAASQWCGSRPPGTVDRGEGFSTMMACSPSISSSVTFREGIAKHPLNDVDGIAQRLTFSGNTVDVVAPDQETLDAIVASAHQFTGADSRGCAATFDHEAVLASSADYLALPDGGPVFVCRYAGVVAEEGTRFVLAESTTLASADADRLLEALATESSGASGSCSGSPEGESTPWAMAIEVRTPQGRVAAATAGDCSVDNVGRTADGEFDSTELLLSATTSSGNAGSPEPVESGEPDQGTGDDFATSSDSATGSGSAPPPVMEGTPR